MAPIPSLGKRLADTLRANLNIIRNGPVDGDRTRPIIEGVTPDGSLVDGMSLDGFLAQAGQILRDSRRVYKYGNTIVQSTDEPGDQRLTTLGLRHRPEPHAAGILANHFGVGHQGRQGDVQSLAAGRLVAALLADEFLWRNLPEILYYARRPTFDLEVQLCRPGWNPESGILIHAPAIIPACWSATNLSAAKAIDRLPPRLKALLGEFYWRSDADLVNALAMLLTGILINHFVDDPHPGAIVDANQSEIGKTLLVQVIGRVLDGAEPPRISLSREDELEKRLCTELRNSRTSLLFLDNVRDRIDSPVIEQNMLSPVLSFRILGRSDTIERVNTYLWFITSNMTAGTPDVIGRCVPIQLHFEGDPKGRTFAGNPLAYATLHRQEILGELAGMVQRWVEMGRPLGVHKHRCDRWAAVIGGILDACGLGEFFLANVARAQMAMDQGLLDLATIAEHVAARGPADLMGEEGENLSGKGAHAREWLPVFAACQVMRDRLGDANPQGRATAVGIFLGTKLGRTVAVETPDGPRRATLRRWEVSAGQKLYYFELADISNDETATATPATDPCPPPSVNGHVPVSTRTPRRKLRRVPDPDGRASAIPAEPNPCDPSPAGGSPEWL